MHKCMKMMSGRKGGHMTCCGGKMANCPMMKK